VASGAAPDVGAAKLYGDHIHELKDCGAPLDPGNVMLRCAPYPEDGRRSAQTDGAAMVNKQYSSPETRADGAERTPPTPGCEVEYGAPSSSSKCAVKGTSRTSQRRGCPEKSPAMSRGLGV
jgi:hypothetical protein